jgi:hypothetical protein
MMSLAVVTKVHLKPPKGITVPDQWKSFLKLLFEQPEYKPYSMPAQTTMRKKFEDTLKVRGLFHGWLDANGTRTGNLSIGSGSATVGDDVMSLLDQYARPFCKSKLTRRLAPRPGCC